jgi:hypothetical protein
MAEMVHEDGKARPSASKDDRLRELLRFAEAIWRGEGSTLRGERARGTAALLEWVVGGYFLGPVTGLHELHPLPEDVRAECLRAEVLMAARVEPEMGRDFVIGVEHGCRAALGRPGPVWWEAAPG